MKNIWFLRTDKDNYSSSLDISEHHPFIYSAHGSCGKQQNPKIQEYKSKVFPKLLISTHELRDFVRHTKLSLVNSGDIDMNEPGKTQCDLFISYWVATMAIGDIVFVRNKRQDVFICQVSGYVSEPFFDEFGSFQRPVRILQKISANKHKTEKLLQPIWHRTLGRRTLERNRNKETIKITLNHIETFI